MTTSELRPGGPGLLEAWQAHRQSHGPSYPREVARSLGVSEAELLASRVGQGVTRLRAAAPALVQGFAGLGRVKTMTRNEHAIIERWGRFENVDVGPGHILVLGEAIDLRIFPARWKIAFAVSEEDRRHPGQERLSLQVFDVFGTAVHKVYLEESTGLSAYQALVQQLRSDDQRPEQLVELEASEAAARSGPIDVSAFLSGWDAMRDTHEFFGLLMRHQLGRRQALRLAADAGGGAEARAVRLSPSACAGVLYRSARVGLPIMIFVGNPGVIQIHTGPIANITRLGGWLNVLDHSLNVHLRDGEVAEAFLVRKPTSDGVVTSIELLDAAGETVALVFGKRKPGIPEDPAWRDLASELGAELTLPEAANGEGTVSP